MHMYMHVHLMQIHLHRKPILRMHITLNKYMYIHVRYVIIYFQHYFTYMIFGLHTYSKYILYVHCRCTCKCVFRLEIPEYAL